MTFWLFPQVIDRVGKPLFQTEFEFKSSSEVVAIPIALEDAPNIQVRVAVVGPCKPRFSSCQLSRKLHSPLFLAAWLGPRTDKSGARLEAGTSGSKPSSSEIKISGPPPSSGSSDIEDAAKASSPTSAGDKKTSMASPKATAKSEEALPPRIVYARQAISLNVGLEQPKLDVQVRLASVDVQKQLVLLFDCR